MALLRVLVPSPPALSLREREVRRRFRFVFPLPEGEEAVSADDVEYKSCLRD